MKRSVRSVKMLPTWPIGYYGFNFNYNIFSELSYP